MAPRVDLFGHFAVIDSYASHAAWGLRRLALIEINPELVTYRLTEWGNEPNLRIDKRLKAVKKIVHVGRKHKFHNKKGYFCFMREYQKLYNMAHALERLWPCHMLSKHWPKEL